MQTSCMRFFLKICLNMLCSVFLHGCVCGNRYCTFPFVVIEMFNFHFPFNSDIPFKTFAI